MTIIDGDGRWESEERNVDALRGQRRRLERVVLRHGRADQEDEVQNSFGLHKGRIHQHEVITSFRGNGQSFNFFFVAE